MEDYPLRRGAEISTIFCSDGAVIRVGELGCKSITVVDVHGQMAAVPWFRVESENDPPTLYNAALIEGCQLKEAPDGR